MKRFTMSMTLAAAALTIAAGTASAQAMKAEIPFAFRVGSKVMQPGEYRVSLQRSPAGAPIVTVSNMDLHRTVLLVASYQNVVTADWAAAGLPKMTFACAEGSCVITRLWTGEGNIMHFNRPGGKNGDPHIAEITLRPDRAN